MKFKDIRTIESLLVEYGMKAGSSTPTSQQQTGTTAKANAVSSPTVQKNTPKTQSKGSPTVTPGLDVKEPETEPETPQFKNAKAKDMDVDSEYHNEKGEVVGKVVSKVGDSPNPDKVVVQDPKGEYQLVDPDEEVQILNASKLSKLSKSTSSSFNLKKQTTHKKDKLHKLRKKMGKLVRKFKLREQGEPIFEINFNSKELAKGALNANIQCGFEAETVWPNLGEGADPDNTDWLDDLYWNRVSDLIYDQEGSRALERVEEAYREWLQEEIVYEFESEVVAVLVDERKEDEAYIDDFVSDKIDMDEVEEYKTEKLERLEIDDMQDELEEYSDWDMDAWAREYVEMEKEDELVEWLEEQIRDNGEAWDDAWQRAQDEYDMDDWVRREHGGSWWSLLGDHDIYLYNEDAEGGGVDAVASLLEDWASNNSKSNDVRPGSYHSGQGVDNDHWRVEDDSSIDGEGAKAEIISPVYDSPAEMLKEMKSLFEYMDNNDAQTNSTTGLHVTMSWMDSDWAKTNKLKMAVLLGDKYVLKQFGREENGYTKSQQETLQQYIKNLQNDIKDEKSLAGLEDILLGGISDGKFSSINFKNDRNVEQNNLIEFRVAGGDDYHLMSDKVMKAVIRYAAVMQAGHDEDAYRKDYIKALFKMIAGKDTVSTDVVKRAQTMVDPASINDKVLASFQSIASEKHYTDAIEALSNAYMELADAMSAKNANPQQELQFEDEGDEVDWRRTMIKAQKYFVRAFAMLASDVASGVNRAKPTATVIASLRQALKDFSLTPKTLWDELQQSEFVKNFPGEHHIKMEKIANAVNSLLKKQDAKAPEAAYTITVPKGHILMLPEEKAQALFGDIFADKKPDETATISQKDFKLVNEDHYEKIKRARYEMEYNEQYIEREQETIDGMTDSIKTQSDDPQRVKDLKDAIRIRQERIAEWQAENSEYRIDIDAFVKKYGFAPKSARNGSEPIGPDHRIVFEEGRKKLSQRFNIRFDVQENKMTAFDKFDKLPLLEQIALLEKIDKKKIDEAWNKRKTNAVLPTSSSKTSSAMKNSSNLDSFTKKVDIFSDQIKNKFGFKTPGIQRNDRLDSFEVVFKTDAKELMNHSRPKKPNLVSYKLTILDDFSNPDSVWMTLVQYVERWKRSARSSDTETTLLVNQQKISSDNVVKTISDFKRYPGLLEAWSAKYKKSIDCNDPKGFSQKAHCAGKKKNENATGKEENEFHKKLDKLVHKTFGHSSDEKRKKSKVKESAVNNFDRSKILNNLMSDHFPVGDLKKQMLAYQAIPVPAMLDEFRRLRAEAGDDACARNIVRMFTGVLPEQQQEKLDLNESKIFESSNKEDAKELVQLSSTPSVLATVVKYLRSLVSKQEPQQDVPQDTTNPTDPTDDISADQAQQVEKESIIKEDLNTLKQEAFSLIDKVKDEVELNQLVAFLRKNEIFELAHSAIEANITQGVKGGLDKKLGQMVLDTPGTFEDKEQFLQQLSTGNGFWDGQDLITNSTGNIYDKLSSNSIAKELAKPLALELRGRMGYGPDQGPGEFLLAFTGKGVDLAEKSDLVLISGKGVEVKAEGWSKDAKGNTKKSGGRLYSTSGYNGGSGAGKVLYNALLQIGVPKDVLATQYGWGVKRDKSVKYPPLNFNSVGVKNINELLQQYGKPGDSEKILDSIAEGFFLSLPAGMKDNFVKKSSKNNQIDFAEAMHNFVALGHAYYKHQEGHDYIMIFNTATGDYVMVNTAEDMKNLLDAGVLKASGGMDFFDDRSKGTPQLLIGKI